MKKLIILTPLLAIAAMTLTSCTTVETPAPTTTTTTTHTESVRRAPGTTVEQTTTRAGGY